MDQVQPIVKRIFEILGHSGQMEYLIFDVPNYGEHKHAQYKVNISLSRSEQYAIFLLQAAKLGGCNLESIKVTKVGSLGKKFLSGQEVWDDLLMRYPDLKKYVF